MTVASSNPTHSSYPSVYSFSPCYSQASPTLPEGQFPPCLHHKHSSSKTSAPPSSLGLPHIPFPSSFPSHCCSEVLLCSSTTTVAGPSSPGSSQQMPQSTCTLPSPQGPHRVHADHVYCHVSGCYTKS